MGLFDRLRSMFGGGEDDPHDPDHPDHGHDHGHSHDHGECDGHDHGHGHGFGHEHPEIHLRANTAEYHAFIVAAELEQGQGDRQSLEHGLAHLSELLAFDPARAEWLEWVAAFEERSQAPLPSLLPMGEERYFAHEALRAYLLGQAGKVEEAIDLLTQVASAKPDVPYLEAWALDWVEPPGAFEALDPEMGLRLLATVLSRTPEYAAVTAEQEPPLRRFARLSLRLQQPFARPELATMADMIVGGLHRRAGLFEEGLARVREQAAENGWSFGSAVAEGLLLRQQGSLDEADAAFTRAGELDPEDVTAMLEAGDMHFERERWAPARAWYGKVLTRQRSHPWADASTLWCRWREASSSVFPDEQFPERLVELAREGNPRAQMLLSTFRPYVGFVPEPNDAMANLVRDLLERFGEGEGPAAGDAFTLNLSHVEGPSNLVALKRALDDLGGAGGQVELSYGTIATPDPREPVAEVAHTLWRRDGEVLVPAVVPPRQPVADAVAELAAAPYEPDRHWASASRLGARLGPDGVEDLLACVPHPPPTPEGTSVLSWIPRVHLVVAQALAHVDDGWDGSARRAALLSLLHGPPDWATTAAIVALTRLTHDHEVLSPEVDAAFRTLAEARPDSGHSSHTWALFTHWISLPHLFDHEREELAKVIEELEAEEEED